MAVLLVTAYFPPSTEVASNRAWALARGLVSPHREVAVATPRYAHRTPPLELPGVQVFAPEVVDPVAAVKARLGLSPNEGFIGQVAGDPSGGSHKLRLRAAQQVSYKIQAITTFPTMVPPWLKAVEQHFVAWHGCGFDLISSSPPEHIAHWSSVFARRSAGVNWIADFRDLWTDNYHYPWGWLRRRIESRLERYDLSRANEIVTISEPLADLLARRHPGSRIHVIPNGIDDSLLARTPVTPQNNVFTIRYSGRLYESGHRIEHFASGLASLPRAIQERIGISVAGPLETWKTFKRVLAATATKAELTYEGLVSREQSIEGQFAADVNLLFLWANDGQTGVRPAKTYEYLAARRPILAIGGLQEVDPLLRNCGFAHMAPTSESVAESLEALYATWQRDECRLTASIRQNVLQANTQLRMSDRFRQLLTY